MIIDPMDLFNNGIRGINLDQASFRTNEKTILIIGQARAGTTMVASLLNEIGIHIGKNFGPVHEDNDLGKHVGQLLNGSVSEDFLEEINKRNHSYPKWAWKRPDMYLYLDKLLPMLRNPQIVCILRDVVSVSRRNEISLGQEPDSSGGIAKKLIGTLEEQRKLLQAVEICNVPALLLSYEKIITKSKGFIVDFLDFLGEDKREASIPKLLSMISPNHAGYSLRARANEYVSEKGQACLIGIFDGSLHGKVSYAGKTDGTSSLELRIDGVVVKREVIICSIDDGILHFKINLRKDLTRKSHQVSLYAPLQNASFENSPYMWYA